MLTDTTCTEKWLVISVTSALHKLSANCKKCRIGAVETDRGGVAHLVIHQSRGQIIDSGPPPTGRAGPRLSYSTVSVAVGRGRARQAERSETRGVWGSPAIFDADPDGTLSPHHHSAKVMLDRPRDFPLIAPLAEPSLGLDFAWVDSLTRFQPQVSRKCGHRAIRKISVISSQARRHLKKIRPPKRPVS